MGEIGTALLLRPYLRKHRLHFNRYADDFMVGIIGSHENAERVKADIRDFLANTLKLTLFEEKTKITHSSELIDYLGFYAVNDPTLDISQFDVKAQKKIIGYREKLVASHTRNNKSALMEYRVR